MDFDEIVETSDAEELAEIEKKELESRNHHVRSSLDRGTPPRKKAKYFHAPVTEEEEETSTLSPMKDESTGIYSPQRSQSSSTMFTGNTSPGPLFTSRSSTRSPGHVYDILSLPKTEEEDVPMDFFSPPSEGSQDPMLLHSPTSPSPHSRISSPLASPLNDTGITTLSIPQSTTPLHSPTRDRNISPSPPLQFPDSPPPNLSQEVQAEYSDDEAVINEHLLFSPTKAASPRSQSLPRTPPSQHYEVSPSSRSVSPEPRRSRSPSSENDGNPIPDVPSIVLPPQPEAEDASIALANEINEELNEGGRYSFRKRTVNQKMPFTTENMLYKRQLKAIPEAIVKIRALERQHHHHNHREDRYEEEGETQQDSFLDDGTNPEDEAWEHMERPRKRRRVDGQQIESAETDVTRYPGILQGLPDTDEEEDKEMDAVTREARRLIKQRAKEKRAKEKEEREQKAREENLKAKRFPVSKRLQQSPKHKARVEPLDIEEDDDAKKDDESSEPAVQPFNHTYGAGQPSNEPSSNAVSAAMREYFGQNEDFDVDNDDNTYHHDVQEDHFGWDRNSPVNERNFTPPDQIGIDNTSFEMPLPADAEEDEERDAQPEASHHFNTNNEIELDLEPRKERFLRKMYPAFMIQKMADDGLTTTKSKPQRPREKEKGSEDEGPLQAGHTRKQIAVNPKDIRDIKGDSESELDLSGGSSDSSTDSSSEDNDDYDNPRSDASRSGSKNIPSDRKRQLVKTEQREVIDLTGYFSAEEAVPSKRRQNKGHSGPRLRDTSAIDYMLARSSRLEPKRSRRENSVSSSHGTRPKFKHDVMTVEGRRYGREKQTTLNFQSNTASSTTHRHPKSSKRKVSSGHGPDGFPDEDNEYEIDPVPLSDTPTDPVQRTKLDSKKMLKERKKKEKLIGVHVFIGDAKKIISGRRELELDEISKPDKEEFQRILLPSSQSGSNHIDWSREYRPPPLVEKKPKRRDAPRNTSNDQEPAGQLTDKTYAISSHFGIPILRPAKSFAPSTYIRKGWLYQLTTLGVDVPQPFFASSRILGFEIGPDMGVEELCSLLPNLFEGLLEYATGLPDPDFEHTRTQWLLLTRGISQLTSWYLKSCASEEASILRNTIQKEVFQLVEQIEQTEMTFIDIPALTVCWFLVDISARLQYHSLPPSTTEGLEKPLQYSTSLLMKFLLQFGVKKTMQPLIDDAELDGTSPVLYSLELWVCLIHILSIAILRNADGEVKPRKSHPFWDSLKAALTARVSKLNTWTPLETSEDVWFTIFGVCTMSQFSVHGMTLSHFHLPADWSIVSFAFSRIHLGKVPQHNGQVSSATVMLDKYVSFIVDRCYELHERYKWRLDDPNTYTAFNELAAIFRVRKFANLVHEESEYSRFFQKADWDLLYKRSSKDSAFTVLLKLVVQAASSDKLHAAGKSSPRVKKFLSLAIPMGSLPFTEHNKPQGNDLTKFYNRITALVIAADLDRSSIDERIQKARSYIDFAKADYLSRIAVIRAMKNWAVMLVDRNMNLKGFSPWVEELASALYDEIKQLPEIEPGQNQQIPKPLETLVLALVCSVRNIINACAKIKRYPYIYLLECLRPLLVQGKLTFECTKFEKEYLLLTESFFWARSEALPPPPRPVVQALPNPDEENQESQDYGFEDDFADMDWSNLDLPDLAAPAPAPPETEGDHDDDNSLRASMKNLVSIRHKVHRTLIPYLLGEKGHSMGTLIRCKRWLHTWFGFASVDGQPSTWTFFLDKIDQELKKGPTEHWYRSVELCIMLNVLKLSPIQYTTYTDRSFTSLLNALVSDNNISSERKSYNMFNREYVSWVLSIDGLRHPLLADMTIDLPARNETSGDYDFGPDEFLNLRIPLLRGIFKNLEKHIALQLRGALEVPLETEQYVVMCGTMFSGMRNNLSRLDKSSDQFTKYQEFSKQVVDALQGNRELCERLTFWVNWRP